MQLEFVFASSDRPGLMSCCREILLGWRDKSPTDFWMGMWHRSEGDDDTGAGGLSSAGPSSMACYLLRQGRGQGRAGRGGAGRFGAGYVGGGAGGGTTPPIFLCPDLMSIVFYLELY